MATSFAVEEKDSFEEMLNLVSIKQRLVDAEFDVGRVCLVLLFTFSELYFCSLSVLFLKVHSMIVSVVATSSRPSQRWRYLII